MLRQRLHAKESRGLGEYYLARATERSKGKGHGLLRPGGDNQSPGIDLLRSGIAHQPCCSRPAVRLRPRRRCITERVEQGSEERSVGKGWVSTCKSRWEPDP